MPKNLEITINNNKINKVESYKYLGINFDYNLRWEEHINKIILRTKYLIFVFYKLSKFMQTETLKIIYYALFHSITNYGIIAWGGAYMNSLYQLQSIQNRLLKIIYKKNFVLKKPLNLHQMFAFESLKYYYNNLKEQHENSKSKTRNKSIILPKIHKTVSNKNNYIKAIKLFNLLPNDLKKLDIDNRTNSNKIKEWIRENIF